MIIKSSHQIDLLNRRRELSNNKRLTFSKINNLRKRGYLFGFFIAAIGISICSWTTYYTFKRIKFKEKLILEANEYQQLKDRYNSIVNNLRSVYKINNQIARGIIGTKSGSAMFLELKEKLPTTIQLVSLSTKGKELNIEGIAFQPTALGSINSLQLQLRNSFLIKNKSVLLTKAWESKNEQINYMNFQMISSLSNPSADTLLANYERLGSIGLYKRVKLLKQEGLIK